VDASENKLNEDGYGYNPGVQKFIDLLDHIVEEYKKGIRNI